MPEQPASPAHRPLPAARGRDRRRPPGEAPAPAVEAAAPAVEPLSGVEAVVVAAGLSRRMEGRDKLEAELAGRSVLQRSVEALVAAGVERIALVTAPGRVARLAQAAWLPPQVVAIVAGGTRRQESVAAGLAALAAVVAEGGVPARHRAVPHGGPASGPGMPRVGGSAQDPVVLVHDAARPFVSTTLVRAVAAAAIVHGAAIPVLPVAETLKRLDGAWVGETIDRSRVAAAQTPQAARRSLFERAYAAFPPDGPETWTDEASLLEACRIPVHAIQGEASNFKVTVPADLERAGAVLAASAIERPAGGTEYPPLRVGYGVDSHPFGPGGGLALGGLRLEAAPRLQGHSDGDVVLHAVADALLGGAGLGDLGRLFPADARTPLGVDSRELLGVVVERVEEAGWHPVNVDVTITAARPRLGPLLPAMAETIARILRLAPGAVNMKASSGNLSGSEGAGRSISASAVISLTGSTGRPPSAVAR